MNTIKIMPCLDMKNGRVVKGIHFVDIKDAGDPAAHAEFYQKEGADELAMLDIAATLENRKTRLEWVKNVSSVIDIPLTVGGGIGSIDDIEQVLAAGADKVSMNSAAVKSPQLVREAAGKFGSEKIVVAIDGRRNKDMPSGFEVVVSGGTKPAGRDAVVWARECQKLGAGVILPTSMDGDGTRQGMILLSHGQLPMRLTYRLLRQAGQGRLNIFMRAWCRAALISCWQPRCFTSAFSALKKLKSTCKSKGLQVNL